MLPIPNIAIYHRRLQPNAAFIHTALRRKKEASKRSAKLGMSGNLDL